MAQPDLGTLNNVNVLVTRPIDQQGKLVELIEAEGGRAVSFPTIEIAPTNEPRQLVDILRKLDSFNLAVFVSPNAAHFVFAELKNNQLELPEALLLACVGKGCAQSVEENGYTVHAMPVSGIGSEGLLQHELLQVMQGKRVVIFRGNGGRELLADSLRERGAEVVYSECYRRKIPDTDPASLLEQWHSGGIDYVTITSTQAFTNLAKMIGSEGNQLLSNTPLIALSERIANVAENSGCQFVITTSDTSDHAIVSAIKQWHLKQKSL